MPEGVIASVDGGFATIDFVDRKLRGPGLSKLLAVGGPESIEVLSRSGPRKQYRVPEGNAREAGLLDEASGDLVVGDTGAAASLADAGSTEGQPSPTTSANTWSTGREPVTEETPASDSAPEPVAAPEPVVPPVDDEPSAEWKLDRLRAYAIERGLNVEGLRSKAEVLAVIEGAKS